MSDCFEKDFDASRRDGLEKDRILGSRVFEMVGNTSWSKNEFSHFQEFSCVAPEESNFA